MKNIRPMQFINPKQKYRDQDYSLADNFISSVALETLRLYDESCYVMHFQDKYSPLANQVV